MDYTIEKNLIEGLRRRDNAAFEHLHKTSYNSIASIVKSYSGTKEDAEDLYYDGIECLLNTIDDVNLEMTSKVRTLLYKICSNRYNNILKKLRASKRFLNEQREESFDEETGENMDRSVYKAIFWNSFEKLKEDCQTQLYVSERDFTERNNCKEKSY